MSNTFSSIHLGFVKSIEKYIKSHPVFCCYFWSMNTSKGQRWVAICKKWIRTPPTWLLDFRLLTMDGQRLRNHFFTMALREVRMWFWKLNLLVWCDLYQNFFPLQPRALDIALRLPPLFLMDQLLLHDMGLNFFDKQVFESNGNVTTQKSHFHVLSFVRYLQLKIWSYFATFLNVRCYNYPFEAI